MIEHIKHIKTSGTIVRSSPFLISRLLRAIDFRRARTVVQLGVGTGCITRALLKKLHPDARLLGLELNQVFVEENRDLQDPRLHLVQGCASALPRFAREHGLGEVDYIVSSLPLAIMNKAIVERILRDAGRLLAPRVRCRQRVKAAASPEALPETSPDRTLPRRGYRNPTEDVYQSAARRHPAP